MEESKKCSSKGHNKNNANFYCPNCNIYICKNCEISHANLFQNHNLLELNNNIKDIFTGICEKENHNEKLEFFCKTHNELCCVSCLCVIKGKGKGQHSSCEVCYLEDIKEDKKNSLINNIKLLEELSNKLDESINNLKNYFQKIDERKENLKQKFMNIFTKLRNALNEREDEILKDIDNEFNKNFIKEDFMKTAEKLPKSVKKSLENGKIINNEWEDENKLNFIIYNCISIENNIKNINLVNDKIEKCQNVENNNVHIWYEDNNFDDEINHLLEIIKYIAKNDKLNAFIKEKEIKNELSSLKNIKKLYGIITENKLSKFYSSNTPFYILSRCNENKCLDNVSSGGINTSPHLWDYQSGNFNQIFVLIKNEDETFSIKNDHSGYYLGMEQLGEEWKIVSREKGKNLQKYEIIYSGEKDYILFMNENGKIIDLIKNKTDNGEKIEPNNFTNSYGQQRKLY